MKTRYDLIAEMTSVASACYNHYSDEPLSDPVRAKITQALSEYLPTGSFMQQWSDDYDSYQKRLEENPSEWNEW